jgi:hypothetical protein
VQPEHGRRFQVSLRRPARPPRIAAPALRLPGIPRQSDPPRISPYTTYRSKTCPGLRNNRAAKFRQVYGHRATQLLNDKMRNFLSARVFSCRVSLCSRNSGRLGFPSAADKEGTREYFILAVAGAARRDRRGASGGRGRGNPLISTPRFPAELTLSKRISNRRRENFDHDGKFRHTELIR